MKAKYSANSSLRGFPDPGTNTRLSPGDRDDSVLGESEDGELFFASKAVFFCSDTDFASEVDLEPCKNEDTPCVKR